MQFIIAGIITIIISGVLTNYFRKKVGFPKELAEHLPGTGVIPKWVSLINLGGWALVAWGGVSIFL